MIPLAHWASCGAKRRLFTTIQHPRCQAKLFVRWKEHFLSLCQGRSICIWHIQAHRHTQSFDICLVHRAWGRPEKPLTLPLRLCTRKAMLGDISSRSDSCSESFFFNLSMTLLPLLALWRVGERGRQRTWMSFSYSCPNLCQHTFSDPWSLPSESSKMAPGRRNAVNRIHRAPAAQEGVISAISLQPDLTLCPVSAAPDLGAGLHAHHPNIFCSRVRRQHPITGQPQHCQVLHKHP